VPVVSNLLHSRTSKDGFAWICVILKCHFHFSEEISLLRFQPEHFVASAPPEIPVAVGHQSAIPSHLTTRSLAKILRIASLRETEAVAKHLGTDWGNNTRRLSVRLLR
jgi:hypothetical protein